MVHINFWFFADGINILGGSLHAIKKNSEALVVTSKEIVREINFEMSKYLVMYREQDVGRSHGIKMYNSSFERMEEFKYLGTTSINQNSFHEEINSRLKSGNVYHRSVQNLLFSSLLSKNLRIKEYRTTCITLPDVYACATLSLTLWEERKLKVFENKILRRICWPKRNEVTGEWRKLYITRSLTFQSLVISLRTTRFNIQKSYMMLALRFVYQNRERPLLYMSLTGWFL
jgi:hypothetical protein